MYAKLEIDVYGHWNNKPPVYRIFIDDEMVTERTFGWPSYQNYITEHIACDLDTGVHTLRLQNLDEQSRFEIENFLVNNELVDKNFLQKKDNFIDWQFVVDNEIAAKHKTNAVKIEVINRDLITPPPEIPKKMIITKNYETYIPLVQRARQLNAKK